MSRLKASPAVITGILMISLLVPMSAAAASDSTAPKRLSGFEQRTEKLHKKIDKLAQRPGKVKRSSRLRHKVRRTNALVRRLNRSLTRLGKAALTVTEADDAFVAEVLACNAAAAHLDRDAIRLSRRSLRRARSREVNTLSRLRTKILALSAKLREPRKPSAPTPSVTPTPTDTSAPTTGNPVSAINNASSGQTVVCPAGTFTGNVRVPSGVTVIGQGMDETRIVGSLTWGSGTSVRDLAVGGPGQSHAPASYSTADTRFERVRFYGGGSGGGVIGWNNRAVTGLTFQSCEFARNFGTWASNGGAGLLWFAVDTGQGTVIRDVNILDCHFGVSNGVATGSPTYGIVFWQSDEAGDGYWGDVLIEGNTFEVTAEFTLDFDGLMTREYHNDVVIRDNLIKGCGLPHDGGKAAWPYSICVEPSRRGTVIENNVIGKGRVSGVKLTKGTTHTVVRNNTFDYRTNNGVTLYYADYFRTISIFSECTSNTVTGNTVLLPSSPTPDSRVIANEGGSSNSVSGNSILR
ncbi:MAG: right-handed parallel beta-helix repeat-containing protein [Thermoleophilia bacterium]|nr:right-handed parallel beta-helix repeat-containing protein [Thermoleophilia bacterium]